MTDDGIARWTCPKCGKELASTTTSPENLAGQHTCPRHYIVAHFSASVFRTLVCACGYRVRGYPSIAEYRMRAHITGLYPGYGR